MKTPRRLRPRLLVWLAGRWRCGRAAAVTLQACVSAAPALWSGARHMFQGRFRLLVSRTLQAPTSTSICSPGRPQARVYDDKVREFVENIGLENIGKRLINNPREGGVCQAGDEAGQAARVRPAAGGRAGAPPAPAARPRQAPGWAVLGPSMGCFVTVREQCGARACLGSARRGGWPWGARHGCTLGVPPPAA